MNCPVTTDFRVVLDDCTVRLLDDINLPVKAYRIDVLLLLLLALLARNLSSPISPPGNTPVDPMWNLGDFLVLSLFTSTTSLTPSCPLTLTSEVSVVISAGGEARAHRMARSSRGDI
jgi:hypothetical protein